MLDFLKINISLKFIYHFSWLFLMLLLIVLIRKGKDKNMYKNQYGVVALFSSLSAIPITYIFFKIYDYYILSINPEIVYFIKHNYFSIALAQILFAFSYYLLVLSIVLILRRSNLISSLSQTLKWVIITVICLIPLTLGLVLNIKNYTFITNEAITVPYKNSNLSISKKQKTYSLKDITSISFMPNVNKYISKGMRDAPSSYKVFDSYKVTFKDGYTFDTENDSSPYMKYNFHSNDHELIKTVRLKNKEKEYKMIKFLSERTGIVIENEKSVFEVPQNASF